MASLLRPHQPCGGVTSAAARAMNTTGQTPGTIVVPLPSGKSKEVSYIVDMPGPMSRDVAVLLLHGAGGDAVSGHLPRLAAACVASSFPCVRITCRGGNLDHRVTVTKAVLARAASLPGLSTVRAFVLAGHSMGARVACAVATEAIAQQQEREEEKLQPGDALPPVTALMLFSYPLHPPGKPQQLRDGLLAALPTALPVLVVRGSSDVFSQQAVWDAALARLPASPRWRMLAVEDGDHGLRVSGKDGAQRSAAALEEVAAAVRQFLQAAGASGAAQQPAPGQVNSAEAEPAAAGHKPDATDADAAAADAHKSIEDDKEGGRRTTRSRGKRRAAQQSGAKGQRHKALE